MLWIDVINESFKPTSPDYLTTYEVSYDKIPSKLLLNSYASQSLLLAEKTKDEDINTRIFCNNREGVLLFDSKKSGYNYYDSKGRRYYVEGLNSIHFLDDPSQLKIILQSKDDGD